MLYKGCHNDFPQFSAAVGIFRDDKRGRYVEALEDIPPGALICLDTGRTVSFKPNRCVYCMEKLNVASRTECPKCEKNIMCRVVTAVEGDLRSELRAMGLAEFAVRVVLSYSAEEVLKYTEQDTTPPSSLDTFSFDSIAALETTQEQTVDTIALQSVLPLLVERLKWHPEWSKIPDRFSKFEKALRFVLCRLPPNAHSIFEQNNISQSTLILKSLYFLAADLYPCAGKKAWILHEQIQSALVPSTDNNPKREDLDNEPLGVGLFPIASTLNHSCKPNTFSYFTSNRMMFRSRGIKKGEEVTDCYGPSIYTHVTSERSSYTSGRGFTCHCEICVSGKSTDDILVGTNDGKPSDVYLTDMDQFNSSHSSLLLKLHGMSRIYKAGNVELDRIAHFTAVECVRSGDLASALSCLDVLSESQVARSLTLSPEVGHLAHAKVLIFMEIYEKTKREEDLHHLCLAVFRTLSIYRTFYGKDGFLTKTLMRSVDELVK